MPYASGKKRITYQQERRQRLIAAGICSHCGKRRPRGKFRVCAPCRQFFRDLTRELKRIVIEAYGGKCICCGETMFEFLSIDHKRNDGAKERKRLGNRVKPGLQMLRYIIKMKFPKRYQLLCFNCNMAKGFYGKCPHKK